MYNERSLYQINAFFLKCPDKIKMYQAFHENNNCFLNIDNDKKCFLISNNANNNNAE